MPLVKKNGAIVCVPKRAKLGSEYENKRHQVIDTRTGNYWETNPDYSTDIQIALLKKQKAIKLKIRYTYTENVKMLLENRQ